MEVESLAPTHINWGVDNRLAMLRYPAERGEAARVELRVGDGTRHPSAVAAMLFAGLDGIDRELALRGAVRETPYESTRSSSATRCRSSLGEALDALAADTYMTEQIGARLTETSRRSSATSSTAGTRTWRRSPTGSADEYAHHL